MAALHLHVHRHPGAQLANLKTRVAAGIQQATKLGLSENVSDKTDALLEMAKSA